MLNTIKHNRRRYERLVNRTNFKSLVHDPATYKDQALSMSRPPGLKGKTQSKDFQRSTSWSSLKDLQVQDEEVSEVKSILGIPQKKSAVKRPKLPEPYANI